MAKAKWLEPAPRFQRKESEFRRRIEDRPDAAHPAVAGRYHLYVQYACPWAHRTLLHRALLGLEDAISVDVVSWRMTDEGAWRFEPGLDGCTPDSQLGADDLQEVYRAADGGFAGVGTVPVLWDKQARTIVNNESRDIMRMLNTDLAPALGVPRSQTLLPEGLEHDVDAMIDANYESVNNGVYKCGFARDQQAYDEAIGPLFERLDELDEHMRGRTWLVGDDVEQRAWAGGGDRRDGSGGRGGDARIDERSGSGGHGHGSGGGRGDRSSDGGRDERMGGRGRSDERMGGGVHGDVTSYSGGRSDKRSVGGRSDARDDTRGGGGERTGGGRSDARGERSGSGARDARPGGASQREDGPGILTEADIALWTTLLRFDPVYHTHFKCNVKKIAEYPALWALVKRLYHLPGVADTVRFDHIRSHYYWSHTRINPFRIVPAGPDMERLLRR